MRKTRDIRKILIGQPLGNRLLGRPRMRYKGDEDEFDGNVL
jgi:hypothetical protein